MARAKGHASWEYHFLVDAAVSSVMWMASDAIAQTVEINCNLFPGKKKEEHTDDPEKAIADAQGADVAAPQSGQKWDYWRTARFGIVGVPSGIWLHAWFRVLDSWFPNKTLGNVIIMAAIDWVGECPYIFSNMSMNAYLENFDFEQVKLTIRNDYCACNLWNFIFWFPADILMFYYIPVKYQLLCVRCSDLIFLPVDSYFSNRSIAKPGTTLDDEEEEEGKAEGCEGVECAGEEGENGAKANGAALPKSRSEDGCACSIM